MTRGRLPKYHPDFVQCENRQQPFGRDFRDTWANSPPISPDQPRVEGIKKLVGDTTVFDMTSKIYRR